MRAGPRLWLPLGAARTVSSPHQEGRERGLVSRVARAEPCGVGTCMPHAHPQPPAPWSPCHMLPVPSRPSRMEKAPELLLPGPPSGTSEPGAAWAGARVGAKGPDLRRRGPQARDVATSAQFPPAPTGIPRLPCTAPQLWGPGSGSRFGSGFAHPAQTQLPAKARRNQIGCLRNFPPPPAAPGWLSWSPSPGSAPGEGRSWKLLRVSLPLACLPSPRALLLPPPARVVII